MLLEVRPSEGGDDAVLFARQLRSALTTFARSHGCHVSPDMDTDRTYCNQVACEHLLSFVGTHRIQRVPPNDKRGRRHTSTASVALVSELEHTFVEGDIEFMVSRGSGPGGQHRNKTESAVTARHIGTGIEVRCQDSRSQWSNKQSAAQELLRRLTEGARSEQRVKQQSSRREQILSGERPVKSFTWNEQRDEVLDHNDGRRWRMRDAFRGRF